MNIRKILIAHDGSTQAGNALDLAMDMAKAFDAELLVLHVKSSQPLTEGERRLAQTEYQNDLQQAVAGSAFLSELGGIPATVEDLISTSYEVGLQIRTAIGRGIIGNAEQAARSKQVKSVRTMLADGDPASMILKIADQEKPDLLVMGSRGLGGIQRLLTGSVSQKVCNSAECTVVVVR
jgi:nucleotide-binding universal stress UspA family protein